MGERQKYLLVPLGSWGDVYPFVWLGEGLLGRGHEVAAVTHPPFDAAFERAGIRTLAYGSREEYELLLREPDIWHPRRGFNIIARMAGRLCRELVPRIEAEQAAGRTLLVQAGIAFGARVAAERFRIPFVTVQMQPSTFLSVEAPPIPGAGLEWLLRSPRWLRRLCYGLAYLWTDRLLGPPVNGYRAELGLTRPVRGFLREYWMSPLRVLGLFPDWFGPKRSDWPPQTVLTRFPLYDEAERRPLPEELERFLAAGEPPVVVTPGSANRHGRGFLTAAVEACGRLGRRAVLLTPFSDQLPAPLPPSVRHYDYAPFGRLLPRSAALIHHGGIGTVAQGLAAGIPQLVMAMSHDQPDNGSRVQGLGAGKYLYPRAFTPGRVEGLLRTLLTSAAVGEACRACRERIRAQMPAEAVVELLEEVHPLAARREA